ncbi:aldehyde dehydrogenase family protein [Oceanibacterium hippocampi]|uniref:Sulfoacetaldehyde dehydrogenase n=1 Tax=Oceanibacterium hippocampi TaxID=745714 RepID=A0A1Y5T908_9PROT|nr:aldehyde dehydrogenase family protein [Oceanibacterium hippocampi]SLN58369.1 Sulfoacetaldehyde dehydrogenase [Oceanibacterium hippocampi]
MQKQSSLPHFPLMVPGASSAAPDKTVTAAFDEQPIATLAAADGATVETALATAYRLFRDRDAWIPIPKRIEILEKAAGLLHDRAEELARETAREGGKPLVDSQVEVARAIDSLKLCVETLRTETGHVVPMGITGSSQNRMAMTRREPIGVVAAVSAFNHPLNLIAHQVAPAVASGCPVVVKPAEVTPLACLRFAAILHEAGLPKEWCQVTVTESRKEAEALVTDPRVALFSFIGSARVGWGLRSKLAPGARAILEHGGAAPVIVAADADIDEALPTLLKGGFYHAGQVCVSVQRVYAHASIARDLAERLAAGAAKLVVGDPTLAETAVGPLIKPAEAERVDQWVREAVEGGGELLTGGTRIGNTCYAPTVLYNPPADARVSKQEIFGPVVCVYPYEDIDAAIAEANALPYAFQAAVFSRDIDTALHAYARLDASAVMVNDHTAFRVDWMPFAGLRGSGLGVGGIPHTMAEMQIEKMIVFRSKEL